MDRSDGLPRRRTRRRGDLPVATIAELAGVSQPTVSKVLNGRSGVGADTRERVEALLRDHGYRRPARPEPVPTLEVVFYSMLSHIAVEILRGVETVAGAKDLTVGFTDVYQCIQAGQSWAEPLVKRRPTGVIAAFSGVTAAHRRLLEDSGVPLVALDPTGDLHPTPSVGSTNWSGGLAAARHLIELGHRRIAIITGPVRDLAARARHDGARTALDAAGLPIDERLVRNGVFTVDQGRDLGLELLRGDDPPTAIVCGDDLQAFGVYEAARLTGRRVPHDLGVVGFDDIEHCQWISPPLTTVRQPFAEMGATAARMVLALAAGEHVPQSRVELSTSLVVRASTAKFSAR
jgi:DNA-binding LacI/PurR family transcriptional regulator